MLRSQQLFLHPLHQQEIQPVIMEQVPLRLLDREEQFHIHTHGQQHRCRLEVRQLIYMQALPLLQLPMETDARQLMLQS